MVEIAFANYGEWRHAARSLLQRGVPPESVTWRAPNDAQPLLFASEEPISEPLKAAIMIPRAFFKLAENVSRHSDWKRWSVLYRVAWRLTHGELNLLAIDIDEDVATLLSMERAVHKDIYRMRAFVRFRKVSGEDGDRFVAWYEPAHHTLDANAQFFIERFGSMRWAILTPDSSLIWDLEKLETGPGVSRSQAPQEDELEDLWRLYYGAIFNPARLKLKAMRAQLPVGRWNNLPEVRAIPELIRLSRGRVQQMADAQPRSASDFIPAGTSLSQLREAVKGCAACPLCSRASGPVFGEGDPHARVVLSGEQPGNEEDRAGRPFVGPAGQVLDAAIRQAGLERSALYLTNAVKAFKFEERGKRRIHQTPRSSDIAICSPWLFAELEQVNPELIVCLGASAAQAVLGRKIKISEERGRTLVRGKARVIVTYHPSAILRAPDEAEQTRLLAALVEDLRGASMSLAAVSKSAS